MADYEIAELPIPATLDDAGGPAFAAAIELGNEVEALGWGTRELAYSPAEELPRWQPSEFETRRMVVARSRGRIVGRAVYETHTAEAADTGWLLVQVLPEFRGRGIGTALADAVEVIALTAGKTKAVVYVVSPDAPGEALVSPTGYGSVPRSNPEVSFLLGRGYSLEQVERGSRLVLPVADIAARLEKARAASGADYVVHSWIERTPQRWLEDVAVLITRMSTDAPSAGLEEPEDAWTVDRLLEDEERNAANPRERLHTVVEHLPSGKLVGFTAIEVPAELDRPASQEATIVLSERRGHRLGMLLKVANLAHLQAERPGHPSIFTFNAEENRHMLDVNEAVGFQPLGHEGAWKKLLS